MKTFSLTIAFSCLALAGTRGQLVQQQVDSILPVSYIQGENGPHSRQWLSVLSTTNEQSEVVMTTNQAYLELATGLNYWDPTKQQWVESKEEISAYPGGSAAIQGQHKLIFANNLNTSVAIDMQTPDGKELQSHILGLSYYDTASGSNVMIAEVQDCQGVIQPPNQVLYQNAFTDFKADVLYTYTRSGFEQDVILRERPPLPEAFGLSSVSSVLQVLTEFVSSPRPVTTTTTIQSGTGGELTDESLDFGTMKIGSGKAFTIGQDELGGIPVAKEWVTQAGRNFLVEGVAVAAIATQLDELPLPPQVNLKPVRGSVRHMVSNRRLLSGPKLAKATKRPMKVAKARLSAPGLVLDYTTLNTSQTNYTFKGDTTYYLSGNVSLTGTNTTFEGGAVLKYTNNATLTVSTPVTWLGSSYRPVAMIGKDDNTIGESITGSTGTPTNYYAGVALYFDATSASTNLLLQHVKIAQARTAIGLNGGAVHVLRHVQLVNCQNGIAATNAEFRLQNALLWNVLTNFTGSSSTGRVEHLTADTASYLNQNIGTSLYLTNCLLTAVTNPGSCTTQSVSTVSASDFQTVGAGCHYLATDSPYRNAGTTNISPDLLADLQQMTTYPPLVYSNISITTPTTWGPVVQRDADTPDLGYHYDSLDYAASHMSVSNSVAFTLTNGVAVAINGSYGFQLQSGSQLSSSGTAAGLNHLVLYSMVQEQLMAWGSAVTSIFNNNSGVSASVRCRFTDFSAWYNVAGNNCYILVTPASFGSPFPPLTTTFMDCRLRGVWLALSPSEITSATLALTNNLMDRANLSLSGYVLSGILYNTISLRNNLFLGGSLGLMYVQLPSSSTNAYPTWSVYDNVFANVTLSQFGNRNDLIKNGYNGYSTNLTILASSSGGNIWLTNLDFQVGALGSYYYPTNGGNLSQLIDTGSVTNAGLVGLYHYTTTTNQVKEANSIVDIGFHYVATDSNGVPIDTNTNGIPDYLDDANGNGLVDSGEIGWNLTGDLGLKVIITRPSNGSTIP